MTDKKTIWHEPTEIPLGRDFIFIDTENQCHFGSFGCPSNPPKLWRELVDNWGIKKWCFRKDFAKLPAQTEELIKSLESEVSRYKKALEVAINQLVMFERAKEPMGIAVLRIYCEDTRNRITQALKEIDSIKGE